MATCVSALKSARAVCMCFCVRWRRALPRVWVRVCVRGGWPVPRPPARWPPLLSGCRLREGHTLAVRSIPPVGLRPLLAPWGTLSAPRSDPLYCRGQQLDSVGPQRSAPRASWRHPSTPLQPGRPASIATLRRARDTQGPQQQWVPDWLPLSLSGASTGHSGAKRGGI